METLSSFERVMAAIQLREADRIPIIISPGPFQCRYAGYTFPECLADVDKMVAASLKIPRDFGVDAVCAPNVNGALCEVLGSELIVPEDDVPAVEKFVLEDSDDLGRLPSDNSDFAKRGQLPFLLEVVRRLKRAVGPDMPVVGWTLPPTWIVSGVRGQQQMFLDMVMNPELIHALHRYCLGPSIAFSRAMLEAGADLLFMVNPMSGTMCISREHYQEFVTSYTAKMVATLKQEGARFLYHICGDWRDRLDLVCNEGADILHLGSVNMDLGVVKAEVGHRVCLMGNVRCLETLFPGSPEDVRQETLQCINKGAPGGGYILSSDCALPRDTPIENVRAMVATGRSFQTANLR